MSSNLLNELKRRLEDESTPLPKRLCLAQNVVESHHFSAAPKERVVAEWLERLIQKNKLSSDDLQKILLWLHSDNDFTSELKTKLIHIVTQFIKRNPLQTNEIQSLILFIENEKMATQLGTHIDEYLLITVTLLQNLRLEENLNTAFIQKIFKNIEKYFRDSKKKLELIVKFLDKENLETVFGYLNTPCYNDVVVLCQSTLFQSNKKSFFVSFLNTLVRKDSIDSLMAEKGDNIQSVLKVMSAFFTFPNGRTEKSEAFLSNFIEVFISCFKSESQLVFAFCIMAANSLKMDQSYLNPNMKMPPIMFEENDEKIKRNLFLKMLEVLLKYEVDINVRLTDTFGEKISKVEIKKTFAIFLQAVMMGQLKLEGKPDKTSLLIIKAALKLDPVLVEQKLLQILPPLMTAKKNGSGLIESYTDTLNCLIGILFKLSRGTIFISNILPHLKLILEASNPEQFELHQKAKEAAENGVDSEKVTKQIITGNDLFPEQSVVLFGSLTTELMSRQNTELLQSLHKDFEEHCLMMLEEGFVSPSIIILTEVLSSILSTFFQYNKMADHTVPRQIAEDFWDSFNKFEMECLKKFGECVLKLNYNRTLHLSFLKLSLSLSRLKLINLKYGYIKPELPVVKNTVELFDLSIMLPCLDSTQWIEICTKVNDDEAVLVLDQLLQAKTTALQIVCRNHSEAMNSVSIVKTHLIKKLPNNLNATDDKVLLHNLDKAQTKQVAKAFVKIYINTEKEINILEAVSNNRSLLNAILIETLKIILKSLDNSDSLSKVISKSDFDISNFVKEFDGKYFFNQLALKTDTDSDKLLKYISILKELKIYYLEENYILATIFVLLAVKKNGKKKIKRNIDDVLQGIFEMSSKNPDVYKIFPIDMLFSKSEENMVELLTLKNKTSNHTLLIKNILESGVKKVKTDSEIVKKLVEILISKKTKKTSSSKEYFSDQHFQLSCIILPIIAREKRAITTSAYRSILANLQEQLHSRMLKAFKNIDFSNNSSLLADDTGNIDESLVTENNLAILNAMEAFSLSLSKYCETTIAEEIQNLDYLWSGLEFFIKNAIQTIQNAESKHHHVDSSIQLLNVTLRHLKKLETHDMFKEKDKILLEIWRALKSRLSMVLDEKLKDKKKLVSDNCLEDIAVALKFVCELSSLENFVSNFLGDLTNLVSLKKPAIILKKEDSANSHLTSHRVSKYLWINCLKANIVGPKCVAMSKVMFRTCKNLLFWIRQYYDSEEEGVPVKIVKVYSENDHGSENTFKIIKIEDDIIELIRIQLNTLSEVILAAKKISLDFKFLDAIFELQHLTQYILGLNPLNIRCELSWESYFKLYESSLSILNSLLLSREELLEDRWPCYMQCYRALIATLCEKSSAQAQLEKENEEKFAETAHCVEKLTQSMCKRKTHISRLAAYTVADICFWLEKSTPSRMVRQHLENSVSLLIQASDSTYAMAFLRRALAGSSGQMTMTNLYTMYKRYHKYTGNA